MRILEGIRIALQQIWAHKLKSAFTLIGVIIGTLGSSWLIDQLVAAGKIDVAEMEGVWEAWLIQTVRRPMPGVDSALVIVGSDKRGTIFGIYRREDVSSALSAAGVICLGLRPDGVCVRRKCGTRSAMSTASSRQRRRISGASIVARRSSTSATGW